MLLRIIARRLVFVMPVLFGLSLMTFVLSHVVPADPARLYAGPRADATTVAQLRLQYGFNLPIWTQYLRYLGGLLHGDFGYSPIAHRPILADLQEYLPATIELALAAIALVLVVGVPLGVISAMYQGSILDQIGRAVSITGVAVPSFWLGLMAQFLLFDQLGWFPAGGRLDPIAIAPRHLTGLYTVDSLLSGNLSLFVQSVWYLILPATVLGYGSLAVLTRMVRASMLEVIRLDYVRTARAKGLRRRTVLFRHALRNALLPATTVMGLQIGSLLGGALLVETVFDWPGIGRYAAQAITMFDYNAVMAVTLVAAIIYVLVNTLVDIVYAALDPRISY